MSRSGDHPWNVSPSPGDNADDDDCGSDGRQIGWILSVKLSSLNAQNSNAVILSII